MDIFLKSIAKADLKIELELMFMKHYAPNRCLYIKVAKLGTGGGSAEMSHLQNCSLKIYLKRALGGGGGGGGVVGWVRWSGGSGLGGVRLGGGVDVIEELKFLGKFTKKKFRGKGGGGSGWGGGGSGWM